MTIFKSIRRILFRKRNQTVVQPTRSLGFCMIFAGSDLPIDRSHFKLKVEPDDLKRFNNLPADIEPVAFLFCNFNTGERNLINSYSCILIHEKNDELFIYIENQKDEESELNYINKRLKDIDISEYMTEELVDFCRKVQLNFELSNKLNSTKSKKLQKI